MRKLTAGALIALAFLALTAVIVSQSLPTQASDESSKPNASIPPLSLASVASSDAPSTNAIPPRPQALAASVEAEKQPFIGITIETLDDGGVVVRSVLEDGPSDGHLQVDDIITHIDGNEMTSVSDVVEAVKASEPGDVLSFDVIRGDASISVEVVVGEREARFGRFPKRAPFQHQILGQLLHLPDNFVKAELMWDTDDGVKTVRAIAGTIADLNVDAGEFNLIPTDGSDKIFYKINDDTKVMTQKKGDLSGLNDEDRTVVVDVTMNGESDVKLVRQSEARERRGRFNMDIQIGGEGLFRMLPGAPDNFLRGELVWETDDGFKTTRAVAGVIKDLDIDNGKFVLDPADGSDTISYEINDDTNVITRKKGDLSGLNEEDRTLVIDVIMGGESTVKMVQQGEKVGHFQMRGHNGGFKFQFGQHDGFPSGIEGLMDRLPELQERLVAWAKTWSAGSRETSVNSSRTTQRPTAATGRAISISER